MIEKVEQGTPEWFAARLGNVTASRDNYMAQLICERMTNTVAESYTNAAMAWGTETEPLARAAYESLADVLVDEVGYIAHPTIERAGASPDGLIGLFGLLEIKCPNTATHIDTLISDQVPTKHIAQIQWQMSCTGRTWADFVSFDPRLPSGLQMFVKRVEFDAEYVAMLKEEVIRFLVELDAKISKLNERLNHVN